MYPPLVPLFQTSLQPPQGDNNLLFALLRELRPSDVAVHGLSEIRVGGVGGWGRVNE